MMARARGGSIDDTMHTNYGITAYIAVRSVRALGDVDDTKFSTMISVLRAS
eukprot:SAG31_NODE_2652_length_5296_cov_7.770637_7_plen_51_part_00